MRRSSAASQPVRPAERDRRSPSPDTDSAVARVNLPRRCAPSDLQNFLDLRSRNSVHGAARLRNGTSRPLADLLMLGHRMSLALRFDLVAQRLDLNNLDRQSCDMGFSGRFDLFLRRGEFGRRLMQLLLQPVYRLFVLRKPHLEVLFLRLQLLHLSCLSFSMHHQLRRQLCNALLRQSQTVLQGKPSARGFDLSSWNLTFNLSGGRDRAASILRYSTSPFSSDFIWNSHFLLFS